MIWESKYWKEPLLKSARYLQRLRLDGSTSERTYVRIEKEVFFGFYSIRKLLDTFKVSDSIKTMRFEVAWHLNRTSVDYMNWRKIEQNYNLSIQKSETRDLRFICNQFIHSYIFIPSEHDNRLDGFFVVSDRERFAKCYFVKLEQVLRAFRAVGRDYPENLQLRRDPATGQFYGSAW